MMKENLKRENLGDILLYLAPDAKFAFWPNDGRQNNWQNDLERHAFYVRGEWCICWEKSNHEECPTLEQICMADLDKAKEKTLFRIKEFRNKEMSKDLGIVSNFKMAKKSRPELEWSDFLDELEELAKEIA